MAEVELEHRTVEYEDSGGDGPVLVLIGGLAMDWRLWREVIERLGPSSAAWRRTCRSARTGGR